MRLIKLEEPIQYGKSVYTHIGVFTVTWLPSRSKFAFEAIAGLIDEEGKLVTAPQTDITYWSVHVNPRVKGEYPQILNAKVGEDLKTLDQLAEIAYALLRRRHPDLKGEVVKV